MASGNRVYRDRLSAIWPSAGSSQAGHGQLGDPGELRQGRRPGRDAGVLEPGGGAGAGGRRAQYAWWSRAQYPDRYYQICDTTSCQVYQGYGGEYSASNTAVDATRGQVLTYGGKPAFTQFSASSGGRTSAGSVPYLPNKADPYDDWTGNSVHAGASRSARPAGEALPGIGDLKKIKVTSREGGGDWNGRVWNVTLVGGSGSKVITGSDLRSIYGLRSTYFTFK